MMSPDERAEIDALRAEVAELRGHVAQLAVAQVQAMVGAGQMRTRLWGGIMGMDTRDPATDLTAAFENASAVAEALVPKAEASDG